MIANVAILGAVALATIYGDYLIKLAALSDRGIFSVTFLAGASVYGLTAIGWLYLMRDHSLLQIGVMYSSAIILMLAALGYFVFNEQTEARQVVGGALAIVSIILMG
jgi:drug/metabolite transporter (DMT)-like permease